MRLFLQALLLMLFTLSHVANADHQYSEYEWLKPRFEKDSRISLDEGNNWTRTVELSVERISECEIKLLHSTETSNSSSGIVRRFVTVTEIPLSLVSLNSVSYDEKTQLMSFEAIFGHSFKSTRSAFERMGWNSLEELRTSSLDSLNVFSFRIENSNTAQRAINALKIFAKKCGAPKEIY